MTETDPIQQMLGDWGKHSINCSVALKLFFCPEFSIPTVQSAQNHIKKWWKLAWNPVSFHELMSPHATCAPFVLLCTESTCPSHFATPEALGSWSRSPPKSWEVPPRTPRQDVGVNVGSYNKNPYSSSVQKRRSWRIIRHALQELDRHQNKENHRLEEVCSRNYAWEKHENHFWNLNLQGSGLQFRRCCLQQRRKDSSTMNPWNPPVPLYKWYFGTMDDGHQTNDAASVSNMSW